MFCVFHWQEEAIAFGIDWEQPSVADITETALVDIPEMHCPLSSERFEELLIELPPLSESTQYGIDLYEKTINFVSLKALY